MHNQEWPANDYAIGSYIQATTADRYLPRLSLNSTDRVLDIGCGDGSYSTKILKKIPDGHLLGIDSSMNMLKLAEEKIAEYPNFSVQFGNVLTMGFHEQFDAVVSFWCLQWSVDLSKAYQNIYNALKPGGQVFTIMPVGSDPYIAAYYRLKAAKTFPQLEKFIPPVDYQKLGSPQPVIAKLPFKHAKVETVSSELLLPSLDVYRKFVYGISFYQGQVSDVGIKELNEAMVKMFEEECRSEEAGKYWFKSPIYLVTARK